MMSVRASNRLSRVAAHLLPRSTLTAAETIRARNIPAQLSGFSTSAGSSSTPSVEYGKFITPMAAARQPSAIRSLMPLLKIPGMISLGGGLPNAGLFPFKDLSFTVNGTRLQLTDAELGEALQYSPTPGLPKLIQHLERILASEHKRSLKGCSVVVTNGSQDGLTRAFEMLVGGGAMDHILCENPTYSGALSFLQPLGCKITGIATDGEGLIPSELEKVLQKYANSPHKPKALYTIPTGQNPAGSTATLERRKKIYDLVCKYDLLLLEDDPYFFLYYGKDPAPADESTFKKQTIPSYFSMDTEHRVLRFDSFSKVLSSGIRIGSVVGPTPLVDRIALHMQATTLHASGLSQALVSKLLDHLGPAGWDEHVRKVQLFYLKRRDQFHALAKKHLGGLADWTVPSAGMFVWFQPRGIDDSFALIKEKAVAAKVLLVPGNAFRPDGGKSPHVRAAFSTASESDMDAALERFAALLKDAQKGK